MNWFVSEFNIRAWRLIKNYQLEKASDVTLIYGTKGIGKTAMIYSLYQQFKLKHRCLITDALSFSRQFSYAAQENKLNPFRQQYRSSQLLLIDDLQLLAGKNKSIEELHYTYEYVVGNGGKVVITLEDDLPKLDFLGERLASRFLSGVVISIDRLLENELERFLDNYIREQRITLDKSILAALAKRTDNIADAKKSLARFIEFAELQQSELSLNCFSLFAENEVIRRETAPEPMNIIRKVCQTMDLSVEELVGLSQKQKVNEARQLAIYMIRTICRVSYPTIARYFNRNHNTIIIAFQKMQVKLTLDMELRNNYEYILSTFQHNLIE